VQRGLALPEEQKAEAGLLQGLVSLLGGRVTGGAPGKGRSGVLSRGGCGLR
jgi:hypothetical protein